MKDFNGLSLMPQDVVRNSLNIISTAGTLSTSCQYSQLADELIDIALQYLNEACVKVMRNCTLLTMALPV